MDLGLTGHVALVAAASRGLGRATATALAAEGARVMLCSRGEKQLAATAEEITEQTGAEVAWCPADVSDAGDVSRLLDETLGRFGRVDVLVNNAGGPPAGRFDDVDDDAWRAAFETGLLSAVRLVRGVLPSMRERSYGRIVNIASTGVRQPVDGLLVSNTFRLAVAGLAKSLATELAPYGILVNTLGPGRLATDRVAALDELRAQATGMSRGQVRAQVEQMIPAGRYGDPAELGRVAAFLGSAANTYVTGQTVLVDGGLARAL